MNSGRLCLIFGFLSAAIVVDVASAQIASASPEIYPASFEEDFKEITLPGVVADVKVGGAGRYFVFHIKTLRKLAVLDVSEAKVIGYIPALDDSTRFAAGMTKLITVSSDNGVVTRWDLATQEKELSQSIDLGGGVNHVILGAASDGPAIVSTGSSHGGTSFSLDMKSLKTERLNMASVRRGFSDRANIRVSANGEVLGVWESGVSPSGLQTYVKVGDEWQGHYEHDSVGYIVPSPDGRVVYTMAGLFTNQVRRVGGGSGRPQVGASVAIPAIHGPYSLSVSGGVGIRRSEEVPEKVSLMIEGDSRPLATVPNLDVLFEDSNSRFARDGFSLDKRLFLVPDANLVLQVSGDRSSVKLVKFDIEAVMAKSDIDFLIVSSRPPLSVNAGDELGYQLKTKSKAGGVTYSLESAPQGMQLSKSGALSWATSAASPTSNDIIISVSDSSGQSVFHTFKLKVVGSTGTARNDSVVRSNSRPGAIKTTAALLGNATREIKLPGVMSDIVVGGSGRFLFCNLKSLKKIAVIDVSEAKIKKFLSATDDNTIVVAGATRCLVFSLTQGVVTRYRLDTLERDLTTMIPVQGAIQFAGMGSASEGPVLVRSSMGTGELGRCKFQFIDINTMKLLDVTWPNNRRPNVVYRDQNLIRASANGKVFCVADLGTLRLDGDSVSYANEHMRSRGRSLSSANGERFISNGKIFNEKMRVVGDQADDFGQAVPSVTGNYFLSFPKPSYSSSANARKVAGKLYMFGDRRPLVTIKDLITAQSIRSSSGPLSGLETRVFFVPQANVIAIRSLTNDRIDLIPLDVDRALEESGIDYLLVESQSPREIGLGKKYEYPISVKSKNGGVQFSLDSGPKGMEVSSEGVVTWTVPRAVSVADHNVIVSISDKSGQSIFHAFAISITGKQPKQPKQQLAAAEKENQATDEQRYEDVMRAEQQRSTQQPAERTRQTQMLHAAATKASRPVAPIVRTWTDSTGAHKIQGKFIRVIDQETVVIELVSGEQRKVSLARLSVADVYEAVKRDLMQQGLLGPTDSPFK